MHLEPAGMGRNRGRNKTVLRSPLVSPYVLSEIGFSKPNPLYKPRFGLDKNSLLRSRPLVRIQLGALFWRLGERLENRGLDLACRHRFTATDHSAVDLQNLDRRAEIGLDPDAAATSTAAPFLLRLGLGAGGGLGVLSLVGHVLRLFESDRGDFLSGDVHAPIIDDKARGAVFFYLVGLLEVNLGLLRRDGCPRAIGELAGDLTAVVECDHDKERVTAFGHLLPGEIPGRSPRARDAHRTQDPRNTPPFPFHRCTKDPAHYIWRDDQHRRPPGHGAGAV